MSDVFTELTQLLARSEQQKQELAASIKKDFESSEGEKSQKIKELEKMQRQWKQEKDELLRVCRLSSFIW